MSTDYNWSPSKAEKETVEHWRNAAKAMAKRAFIAGHWAGVMGEHTQKELDRAFEKWLKEPGPHE